MFWVSGKDNIIGSRKEDKEDTKDECTWTFEWVVVNWARNCSQNKFGGRKDAIKQEGIIDSEMEHVQIVVCEEVD